MACEWWSVSEKKIGRGGGGGAHPCPTRSGTCATCGRSPCRSSSAAGGSCARGRRTSGPFAAGCCGARGVAGCARDEGGCSCRRRCSRTTRSTSSRRGGTCRLRGCKNRRRKRGVSAKNRRYGRRVTKLYSWGGVQRLTIRVLHRRDRAADDHRVVVLLGAPPLAEAVGLLALDVDGRRGRVAELCANKKERSAEKYRKGP